MYSFYRKKNFERFQKYTLKIHIIIKKQELNDSSQKYAKKLTEKDIMLYSYNSKLKTLYQDGYEENSIENSYFFWSTDNDLYISGLEFVNNWHNKIKDYDFKNECSKNWGIVDNFILRI